ncbi:MAG: family 43 glycosylhydrolase, partial [Halanaerobiales bacterium]
TGYNHAVTIARSKNITGPYEVHPENPILTAKDDPDNPLQKAGHGDLVETSTGEWYLVHLCSRPLTKRGNCNLGRETAIQKIIWKNDWPYLDKDNNTPEVQVAPPDLPEVTWSAEPEKDDFDNNKLNIHFQTLRIPLSEDMMSLKERQGYLRLKGKESLSSLHSQSLVARRQQSFYYTAETCLEFEPDNFKQMAGLVCYYNTSMYYYLYISYNEESGKFLNLITCDNKKFEEPLSEVINLTDVDRVYLQVQVDYDKLQFYYSQDGKEWIVIGPVLDAGKLSDDYVEGHAFTGAFVGMCCQDLSGQSKPADFDYFVYKERDE